MRLNEPITDREILVPETEVLVSGTDTGGRILFANPAFVEVSGFTAEELEGSPHDLMRHPHMPQAAFRDLWATLKAGRPWEGLVKNRAKNGDVYWVRANVTPLVESGKVTGDISIRTRPDQAAVAAAEAAYAALRQGSRRIGLRLSALQADGTAAARAASEADFLWRLRLVPAVGLAGLAILAGLGLLGFRSLRRHLGAVEAALQGMSRGERQDRVAHPEARDFRRVMSLLRALGARLAYAEQEHGELDRRAAEARCVTVREMAGKVEAEAKAAVDAVASRAGGMAAQAAEMAEAAGRVNEVVHLIGDVAAKTNLLALNATIEAARAGDAGKGFAVVAGEVKQLAAQTARATEDISRQLSGIAAATDAAVHAVAGMGRAIGRISDSAGVIAAAVEQQGAATQEIARNVAANGEEVREMAGRIDAVARDALAAGARDGAARRHRRGGSRPAPAAGRAAGRGAQRHGRGRPSAGTMLPGPRALPDRGRHGAGGGGAAQSLGAWRPGHRRSRGAARHRRGADAAAAPGAHRLRGAGDGHARHPPHLRRGGGDAGLPPGLRGADRNLLPAIRRRLIPPVRRRVRSRRRPSHAAPPPHGWRTRHRPGRGCAGQAGRAGRCGCDGR